MMEIYMTLHIGDTAPDFKIKSAKGSIILHDWIGSSWCFFFSHPADLTPACTTEIGRTAIIAKEFTAPIPSF
jgi:alkyl hydroperoxide reductase subunit AhpC